MVPLHAANKSFKPRLAKGADVEEEDEEEDDPEAHWCVTVIHICFGLRK
jgi:hypothetical protein